MIFVFGGEYSGKSDYVRDNFGVKLIEEHDVLYERLSTAAAVRDFHLRIRGYLMEGRNVFEEVDKLLIQNPDIIIISNEIGCGVVPIDKFDRSYRETVGRVNCYLAQKAETVIRVVCGIGVKIK